MTWKNQILGERYRLKKFLGQGGMAKVYLAIDETFDREVAVKVLPVEKAESESTVLRFKREFQVCASLNHSNIVKLFDCGQVAEDGTFYYVMELFHCKDLREIIRKNGPLQHTQVESIVRQLVSAFDVYHSRGIVHRDLKPANIMLDESGRAVITDFGLVYDPNRTKVTQTGAFIGTPAYSAPEQLKGQKATRQTDYYQLGVIIYECLTGQKPFQGSNIVELALTIDKGDFEKATTVNPQICPWWDQIIDRCMAYNPEKRYSSSKELLHDLDAFSKDQRDPPAASAPENTKAVTDCSFPSKKKESPSIDLNSSDSQAENSNVAKSTDILFIDDGDASKDSGSSFDSGMFFSTVREALTESVESLPKRYTPLVVGLIAAGALLLGVLGIAALEITQANTSNEAQLSLKELEKSIANVQLKRSASVHKKHPSGR